MKFSYFSSVFFGLLSGIACLLLASVFAPFFESLGAGYVSFTIIILMPVIVGMISIFLVDDDRLESLSFSIFYPWLSVFGWAVLSVLFAIETLICVIMLLPAYLPLTSIGGLLARMIRQKTGARNNNLLSIAFIIPLLGLPIEAQIVTPTVFKNVEDSIIIDAPVEQVWQNLPNIKNIKPDELKWTFSHFIGLPKPKFSFIENFEIGSVRKSTWENGIYFYEKITKITPDQYIGYDVIVDQDAMKIANLDTHITVGDQYFDVVSGFYKLEDVGGKTKLTISTRYRMTTMVNWYGKIWAGMVFSDFHAVVLNLIKNRNEAAI